MPKGKPKSANPELYKNSPAPAAPAVPVARAQVVDMLAPGTEEEFRESLATPPAEVDEKPKRGRKPKQEVAAETDPLMSDPVYKAAIEDMQGMGVPDLVDFACTAAGKPMDALEERKVKGLSYVIAKRSNVDVGKSWIALLFCSIALVAKLFMARTDIGKQIGEFFHSLKEKPKPPEPEKQ